MKLEKLEEFGLCHKCCSKYANECKVKFVCAICRGIHLTIFYGLYADAAVSAPPAPVPRGDPPTSTVRAARVEADGGDDTVYFSKTEMVTERHKQPFCHHAMFSSHGWASQAHLLRREVNEHPKGQRALMRVQSGDAGGINNARAGP